MLAGQQQRSSLRLCPTCEPSATTTLCSHSPGIVNSVFSGPALASPYWPFECPNTQPEDQLYLREPVQHHCVKARLLPQKGRNGW